jgi:hypothetical protein
MIQEECISLMVQEECISLMVQEECISLMIQEECISLMVQEEWMSLMVQEECISLMIQEESVSPMETKAMMRSSPGCGPGQQQGDAAPSPACCVYSWASSNETAARHGPGRRHRPGPRLREEADLAWRPFAGLGRGAAWPGRVPGALFRNGSGWSGWNGAGCSALGPDGGADGWSGGLFRARSDSGKLGQAETR